MGGPDVEYAGWAADAPGSGLRRGRSPLLGVLALVLLVGGVVLTVVGIVGLVTDTVPSGDEILARGVVAALEGPDTEPARFTAPRAGSATVYIQVGDVADNNRDQIVAATECTITRPDGTVVRFRGNRQGTALDLGGLSTIGVFGVSEGRIVVACRQQPFGRVGRYFRLRDERKFEVVRGRPSERVTPVFFVLGGIAAALLAIPVWLRWRAGWVRPVRS